MKFLLIFLFLFLEISVDHLANASNQNQDDECYEDYLYYDEPCTERSSTAAAYFRLSDYTETVQVGESAILRCDIENFKQNNIVLWSNFSTSIFLGNQRIITDDRFTVNENDHSLTINNVREADQGIYECNLKPNNIAMTVKLVVLSNVHIIESGQNVSGRSITYHQNDRIQVECKASDVKNEINFIWSADGVRLQSNDNIKINGGTLIIEKASRDDAHIYQCLADSGSDRPAHATVMINVQYPLRVVAHHSVVNTENGANAELYCEYDSSTESRVTWSKDQKALQTDKRSKYNVIKKDSTKANKLTSILVVNDVNAEDLGVYECKVENAIGSENVAIELTYAPEPPKLINVERDGASVITHWHIRSMQPLKEIMLNYQLKGEQKWLVETVTDPRRESSDTWEIKHKLTLSPGDWHIRVKSENTEEWSVYSNLEDISVIKELDKNSANKMMSSSMAANAISIISIYLFIAYRLFG